MSNTRLRAADLADEFRFISSDKRMEYVPARANHLLIAADMLDANDELFMRLNSEYRVRQNVERENDKLRELVADLAICACGKYCYGCPHQYDGCDRDQKLRELGVEVDE